MTRRTDPDPPDPALVIAASRARTHEIVLAGLLHDLNGPLNNLRLTLELLERALTQRSADAGQSMDARLRRYLDALGQESSRMTAWSRAASRVNAASAEPSGADSLAALVDQTRQLFRHHAALAEVRLEPGAPAAAEVRPDDAGATRALLATLICAAIAMAPPGAVVRIDGDAGDAHVVVRVTVTPARVAEAAERAFARPPGVPRSPLELDLLAARLQAESLHGEARLHVDAQRAALVVTLPRA